LKESGAFYWFTDKRPVGAGLLAIPVYQSTLKRQIYRHRQQAGSYKTGCDQLIQSLIHANPIHGWADHDGSPAGIAPAR
jgi:hypothetical protein